MEMIRCPHCGKYVEVDDSDYYVCEECSSQFHLITTGDEIKVELQQY